MRSPVPKLTQSKAQSYDVNEYSFENAINRQPSYLQRKKATSPLPPPRRSVQSIGGFKSMRHRASIGAEKESEVSSDDCFENEKKESKDNKIRQYKSPVGSFFNKSNPNVMKQPKRMAVSMPEPCSSDDESDNPPSFCSSNMKRTTYESNDYSDDSEQSSYS